MDAKLFARFKEEVIRCYEKYDYIEDAAEVIDIFIMPEYIKIAKQYYECESTEELIEKIVQEIH